MSELVEAGVGVGAQKEHGQQRDEGQLGEAESRFRVASFEFQMRQFLFVDLTPVRNARNVNRSSRVVDLIHDSVITDANTPLLIAAFQLLASCWARHKGEAFQAWHDPIDHLRGQNDVAPFRYWW